MYTGYSPEGTALSSIGDHIFLELRTTFSYDTSVFDFDTPGRTARVIELKRMSMANYIGGLANPADSNDDSASVAPSHSAGQSTPSALGEMINQEHLRTELLTIDNESNNRLREVQMYIELRKGAYEEVEWARARDDRARVENRQDALLLLTHSHRFNDQLMLEANRVIANSWVEANSEEEKEERVRKHSTRLWNHHLENQNRRSFNTFVQTPPSARRGNTLISLQRAAHSNTHVSSSSNLSTASLPGPSARVGHWLDTIKGAPILGVRIFTRALLFMASMNSGTAIYETATQRVTCLKMAIINLDSRVEVEGELEMQLVLILGRRGTTKGPEIRKMKSPQNTLGTQGLHEPAQTSQTGIALVPSAITLGTTHTESDALG
ncbi:hypothetical protein B0J17DRAFT_724029 [Rhizoctonia solani]|nr:hypothetical protein B0J17DRAFT_724029 [Rhizoctonia solani]